jgi:hypothetical protein
MASQRSLQLRGVLPITDTIPPTLSRHYSAKHIRIPGWKLPGVHGGLADDACSLQSALDVLSMSGLLSRYGGQEWEWHGRHMFDSTEKRKSGRCSCDERTPSARRSCWDRVRCVEVANTQRH